MTTDVAVRKILDGLTHPVRRRDAETLLVLMGRATGQPAQAWNGSIIGYGSYHYTYATGREGDAPSAAFSPRKTASTIYLPDGVGAHRELLARLGPHSTGVGCLYLKDLAQVDLAVLEQIVAESYAATTTGDSFHGARDGGAPDAGPRDPAG